MANKKATMTDLRLLIREFIKGTSKRKISEILNLSRTSIDVYLGRMGASGKSAEELLHSDDKTLSQVMVRDSGHRNTDSEKLDELTPLLEDYAGDRLWIMDPRTRVGQEAYVLVCVLPYSSLAFATAMLSTSMENFFDGLSRCLTYFGGVPLVVKSDNMRQWVKKYDRYEPAFTECLPFNIKRFAFLPKSNFPYCASKVKCCGSHTEGLEDTAYSRNTDAVALF